MTLTLRAPTLKDVEQVRVWRTAPAVRLGLRTPYLLTAEMQATFHAEVVCNRNSPHRYWSVMDSSNRLVAFTGLTDISWENGHGEISLLVRPEHDGSGVGSEVVGMVLEEAFNRMRLVTVFGECYSHNPALNFWMKMIGTYGTCLADNAVYVPRRKMWEGKLRGGWFFWFTDEEWRKHQRAEAITSYEHGETSE